MGNCCSTSSDPSPFEQPGRTLSSAPPKPAPSKSTLPPSVSASASTVPRTYTVGGPARTLGSGSSGTQEDARRKAAEAAEENSPTPPICAKLTQPPLLQIGTSFIPKTQRRTRKETPSRKISNSSTKHFKNTSQGGRSRCRG
ncbi:hypothetical protein BCON_0048g00460 [Botryotinia convoluta]|uniref:Uncharacterized protein n=1 Tax=Botryotinia convoluta TaxID=54673 RepID=A0A4Z1IIV0_9HELO|nr:hypothetical protein BCON_0048g00460 [Botryotinia convoluta]